MIICDFVKIQRIFGKNTIFIITLFTFFYYKNRSNSLLFTSFY